MRKTLVAALLAGAFCATSVLASPAVMLQPKDAIILDGGPGSGSIVDTYNQSGLLSGYTDQVTSLHPYVATSPMHTLIFSGYEWFGNIDTTTAAVSYFVHATDPKIHWVDHLVLWNEESSGIGTFDLWYSPTTPTLGSLGSLVSGGLVPPDNPLADYGPTVFHFDPHPILGWYTLVMSGCPQIDPGSYASCAIGEVAFGGPRVPEPASWAMMIAGFGMLGVAMRRRRTEVAA